MTTTPKRRCAGCADPLPEDSSPRRKWCTERCRKATVRQRRAEDAAAALWAGATARHAAQLVEAENLAGRRLAMLNERDELIAGLRAELAAERRRAAEALTGQLNRSAAVRDRLELSTVEAAELRTRLATAATPGEVSVMRDRLATLRDAHGRLAEDHRAMAETLERVATERAQLQLVVRQWDTLCRRLSTASGGRPTSPADQKILTTWTRFRASVSGGHTRPVAVAGQEATR